METELKKKCSQIKFYSRNKTQSNFQKEMFNLRKRNYNKNNNILYVSGKKSMKKQKQKH